MNVLSLCDGKSSGMTALSLAGIKVGKYYSCEIDKYANLVSNALYPNLIRLGDIVSWREWDIEWDSIDLVLGGTPCQGLSFAGKQLAFDDPRSFLFYIFRDILNHIKSVNSKVKFMLENVRMKAESMDIITTEVESEPVLINSALVSAQNRKRNYWANWDIDQPGDRLVMLSDIIGEKCLSYLKPRGNNPGGFRAKNGKTGAISSSSWEHNNFLVFQKDNPKKPRPSNNKSSCLTGGGNSGGNHSQMDVLVFDNFEIPLTSTGRIDIHKTEKVRRYSVREVFRLQTTPEYLIDKILACGVSNSQLYKIAGNGWTDEVIAHIFKGLVS